MAAPPLVLISGINGFTATEIALAFLQAGYRVRGTVRSPAKSSAWLVLPAFAEYAASGTLETAIVEDIVAEGAFDDALDGVEYFVHTIAQLPRWGVGTEQVCGGSARAARSIGMKQAQTRAGF
jgi:NADPH-dependent methylglyoxal reductase